MMTNRRTVIRFGLGLGAAAFAAPFATPALAQTGPELKPDDYVTGSPDAPVTIFEYASLTCPHCRDFHNETLPQLKAEYIDTGKVKLVFRQFALNAVDLRIGMAARCAPHDKYMPIVDALYQTQQSWAAASDPLAAAKQLLAMGGVSPETFDACVADDKNADPIVAQIDEADKQFGVSSTPTFFIGGEKIEGARPYEEFKAAIDRALAAAGAS
jgi:protein-disulfide isomerase